MNQKKQLNDYTEQEFLVLLQSVIDPEDGITEQAHDKRIDLFMEVSEHPTASDLIYWPEEEGLDTPENIIRI
ncbi:bacteriocin immunity protein, partial [Pseudomonas huaxiensis]|uniref:bacteriocin immunity protein n=1 Tax=Pseudomonas huaxiensis TaxID=2213017 RepID=UPI000DA6DAB5